ncbi:PEP-CTERM/exosortase system-associated acyltransferase [Marinobacter sp. LV10MA510-1]|uniref:PEP-CTERM/exosortase system-associated acyltransferase n=1 Tax=Marinobacter sp. LV10MA510-1 TaxID=1415567 RepID=UPI000C0101BB|nr:PEP-CTERM/exosortase system-associated acyltransferase [Marinobacter sp. LV10MA510-1]PFG11162.1 N-acyl amino acid synthase of PEP-CTERM/exosortase system [Marinobacter sp. LV10MA510-1]
MASRFARLLLSKKEYEGYVERSKKIVKKRAGFKKEGGSWTTIKQKLNIRKAWSSLLKLREANATCGRFMQFFSFYIATTAELEREAYKIRHQVYCEELGWEALRESGEETDEFDTHAAYCLVRHRSSNVFAGTVRIVNSTEENREALPIEKYCLDTITDLAYSPTNFPREDICEFSRLAVPSSFRRRQTDKFPGAATGSINVVQYSKNELRCFSFIAIGLYFSVASLAMKLGKKHAYVMMEPRLARNMGFVGIRFRQIGPVVDYHGRRAPYYINAELLHAHLARGFRMMLKTSNTLLINSRRIISKWRNSFDTRLALTINFKWI